MTIISDVKEKGKGWLINVALKKAVVRVATLIVAFATANAITFKAVIGGISIDLSNVDVPEAKAVPFVDADIQRGQGQVIIDRAHGNRVSDAELNVLLSRLTARDMETVSLTSDDTLAQMLRTA